jgi:hypothetical protein
MRFDGLREYRSASWSCLKSLCVRIKLTDSRFNGKAYSVSRNSAFHTVPG